MDSVPGEETEEYWRIVRSWVYNSNIPQTHKEYVFLYLQHVCNTRKFRVVAEYYDKCNEVGGGNLASPVGNLASPVGKAISRTPNVYVDIENKAIFDAKTGDYIGYIGKHKKMVVLKPPVS